MNSRLIKVGTQRAKRFPTILSPLVTALLAFYLLPKVWRADQFWASDQHTPANAGGGT